MDSLERALHMTTIVAILLGAACASPTPDEAPRRGQAKLAIAIGTVETRVGNEGDYKPIAVGGELDLNAWIRTGPKSKAAFDFTDGTELRINENSEILVEHSRSIEIQVGELLAAFPTPRTPNPMSIKTKYSPITFEGGMMTVGFRNREPDDPLIKTVSRTVTTIRVIEGAAKVGSAQYTQTVTGSYRCTLVDKTLNTPDQLGDISIPTRWTHEILVQRGRKTPEVELRLRGMLPMLSRYPAGEEDLSESGFRSLGTLSVPFLIDYLRKDATIQEIVRRRATARLIGELATREHVGGIAEVLNQPYDAETRVLLAKALEHLTGTNLKMDEAFWRGDKTEPGIKAWNDWVKAHPAPGK
jgi:hypothetical protein